MKRILAAVLASSLLMMTACSEAKETEVTTEETTVSEETSEETSEEISEETSVETSAETQVTFTDGQHLGYELIGDVVYGGVRIIAHDFDAGSNATLEVWEDPDSGEKYPMSPNYPAGEDVVITFKSDVELNALTVAKYIPENVDPMLADHALALAGNSEYPEFISLSREASLTHEGDMYTFSIPGEFIEDGYEYKIGIGTHVEEDATVENDWEIHMYFRCNVQ